MLYCIYRKRQVKSMTRQEKGKAIDYHKNSTNISIRINNDLLTLFDTKREKEGKSRGALISEWMEKYCFGKED